MKLTQSAAQPAPSRQVAEMLSGQSFPASIEDHRERFREERVSEVLGELPNRLKKAAEHFELSIRLLALDEKGAHRGGFLRHHLGFDLPRGLEDLQSPAYRRLWEELSQRQGLKPFIEIALTAEDFCVPYMSVLLVDVARQVIGERVKYAEEHCRHEGTFDVYTVPRGAYKGVFGPRSLKHITHPLARWIWEQLEKEGYEPFVQRHSRTVGPSELHSYAIAVRLRGEPHK